MTLISASDVAILDAANRAAVEARIAWLEAARPKQLLPAGQWTIALWRMGRGAGKTKTMSEAMWWEMWRSPGIIGHYLTATLSDIRGTLFEGPAGLRAVIPAECLRGGSWDQAYIKSDRVVHLSNGSQVVGFSTTEQAERLRGPQCHFLAGDELAAWDKPAGNAEQAFDNAMFGCRLVYPDGTPARAIFATTPKPIPFLKRLEKRASVRVVTGTSLENIANLSGAYRDQLLAKQGTLIGKQEIDGLYIDEEGNQSIFQRKWFPIWPHAADLPEFSFILESWDTASSEENYDAKRQTTDPTGCLTLGVFNVAQYWDEKIRRRMGLRSKYGVLVLDWWTERLGLPDLLDRARRQRKLRWGSPHPGRKVDLALIEDKASGPALRQMMVKWGAPTWPYNPGRASKTTRAHAVSPYVAQHIVWLPESTRTDRAGMPRDWCEEMLEQICGFQGEGSVEHDEAVDCLSQALSYLGDRGMIEALPDEKTIDAEEKKEKEQREALEQYRRERTRKNGNPYGV